MTAPPTAGPASPGTAVSDGGASAQPGRAHSIWTSAFVAVTAVNVVINLAQYMMIAVIPPYAASLGASAVAVGTITGAFAVTALAVRPLVGPVTFRVRANVLLAITVGVIAAAFTCYGLAGSYGVLVLGRLLHGLGMGLLAPVALVMASDTLPPGRMASGIGIFSLGQAVAMAAGPALGLALVDLVGYRATFFASAAFMALALVMALCMSSPAPAESGRLSMSWRRMVAPEALPAAVIIFFLAGAFAAVNSFIVLYGHSLGVADIGLYFTAYAVTMLLARPVAGKVADRFGPGSVIITGAVLFGASFALVATAQSLAGFVLAGVVSALGYGVCQPAVQTLALTSVERERRGVAGSTTYMGVDLAYLVMPVLAGAFVSSVHTTGVTESDSYSLMFACMAVPVALGLLTFLWAGVRTRRRGRARERGARSTW